MGINFIGCDRPKRAAYFTLSRLSQKSGIAQEMMPYPHRLMKPTWWVWCITKAIGVCAQVRVFSLSLYVVNHSVRNGHWFNLLQVGTPFCNQTHFLCLSVQTFNLTMVIVIWLKFSHRGRCTVHQTYYSVCKLMSLHQHDRLSHGHNILCKIIKITIIYLLVCYLIN